MERGEDKLSRTGPPARLPPLAACPQSRGQVSRQLLSLWAAQLAWSVLLPQELHRDVSSGYFLQERTQAHQMPLCLRWEADKGS